MTAVTQRVHGLLGSEEDIAALASMEMARILVVSDSHGARQMLRAVIDKMGNGCNALVFCGDGVADFLSCLHDDAMPLVAAFVRGNNDYDRYTLEGEEIACPARQVLQAAGKVLFVAHGHRQGVRMHSASALDSEADMAGADIVLFGHTHVAEDSDGLTASVFSQESKRSRSGGHRAINPGSLKFPRSMYGPSFAVLEIHGGHRVGDAVSKGGQRVAEGVSGGGAEEANGASGGWVDVTHYSVTASLSGIELKPFRCN